VLGQPQVVCALVKCIMVEPFGQSLLYFLRSANLERAPDEGTYNQLVLARAPGQG